LTNTAKPPHCIHFCGSSSSLKDVSRVAKDSGLSQKKLQKALSENGNPQFSSVNAILHAMGYRLTPQKLGDSFHAP